MAYKFQLDDAIMSGTLVQEGATEVVGNLTATSVISGSSLTLGSAAFSVSAAGAIAGATSIDGSGDLTMGTITMSGFTVDADGDTVGKTLSASAGVSAGAASTFAGGLVLQSSGITTAGAIAGATSIDGSGDLTMGTITMTGFSVDADGDTIVKTLGGATTISGSGLGSFGGGLAAGQGSFTVSSAGAIAGATSIDGSGDLTMGTITMTGFTVDADGDTIVKTLSGSSNLQAGGTVRLDGVADATAAVAADSFYFFDDTDKLMKRESMADYAAALVNSEPGFASSGGKLQFDPNSCVAAAVSVANDSITIIDADDGNIPKKESIADLVTAMAGGGLTATNGVLSTDAGSVAVGADGGTLAEGYNYFTGTVSAACTLPASPTVGDVVTVKAGNTTTGQNITINCAGSHLIDGDATNIHLESPYAAVTLVYVVANDWRLV